MVISNTVMEVFNFNIYACYLSTNRGTLVVHFAQTVCVLHYCKYIAICSINVIVDDFDRFDMFVSFEIDNFPCPKFLFSYIVTKTRIGYFISVSAKFYLYFGFFRVR